MSIHFQINIGGDTTDEAIAEFRKVFGELLGTAVTYKEPVNVTGQIVEGDGGIEGEVIPPAKKTRKAKDKAPEVIANTPLADASSAEKTESVSTSSTTETSSTSASGASSVSIDDLRAKLMALSKTDGGHDTVFGILGKFGAKNASTVPEDKRGEVVALVDLALEVA